MREVEGGVASLAGDGRARCAPLEASRDHEVDDGVEVILQSQHDALAESGQGLHLPSVKLGRRGVEALEE